MAAYLSLFFLQSDASAQSAEGALSRASRNKCFYRVNYARFARIMRRPLWTGRQPRDSFPLPRLAWSFAPSAPCFCFSLIRVIRVKRMTAIQSLLARSRFGRVRLTRLFHSFCLKNERAANRFNAVGRGLFNSPSVGLLFDSLFREADALCVNRLCSHNAQAAGTGRHLLAQMDVILFPAQLFYY